MIAVGLQLYRSMFEINEPRRRSPAFEEKTMDGGNIARSTAAPERETELREFISEFNSTVTRLGELRNRLGSAADRLLGSMPEPGETKPGLASVPGGILDELRSCLNRSQEIIDRAESHVNRIERAV